MSPYRYSPWFERFTRRQLVADELVSLSEQFSVQKQMGILVPADRYGCEITSGKATIPSPVRALKMRGPMHACLLLPGRR
jgi:hypothetical protein